MATIAAAPPGPAIIALEWSERFAADKPGPVLWTDGTEQVLVHVDSLEIERTGRWLACDLDVEPAQARRRRVRFAFLAAVNRAGDTILAEAAIYGRRLNERCATDIQRALKDALCTSDLLTKGTP
jgi:hypothetical protein